MKRALSLLCSSTLRNNRISCVRFCSTDESYMNRASRLFEFEQNDKDIFRTECLSTTRQSHSKAAFGGLIFSQAMAAAEKTLVDETMKPHSVHGFFILNVDTSVPVSYHVRRVRDGRSFATRTVDAVQRDKVAFTMTASYNVDAPNSAVHQARMPSVPSWEYLQNVAEVVDWIKSRLDKGMLKLLPFVEKTIRNYDAKANADRDLFEIRPTNPGTYYGFSGERTKTFYFWCKARGNLGNDPKLNRYMAAYNSDATMAGSVYRPHLVQNLVPSMLFSLDHSLWMHHHDIPADEWLLYENTSDIAYGGRGFATGRLWHPDGRLLMSSAQEIVIRTRGKVSELPTI